MNLVPSAIIAAVLLTASPAVADDQPAPSPIEMGTTYVQTYTGPTPEPFIPSETITLDAPVPYAPTVTPGVVTYRGHTRRAFSVDGVVYLSRTGLRAGPRVAATFHLS